jgi:hypothetical protein
MLSAIWIDVETSEKTVAWGCDNATEDYIKIYLGEIDCQNMKWFTVVLGCFTGDGWIYSWNCLVMLP